MIARSASVPGAAGSSTAAADAQEFRLPRDGQVVLAVDHRLALSKPALLSAPCGWRGTSSD
jgi:hypothetical protein